MNSESIISFSGVLNNIIRNLFYKILYDLQCDLSSPFLYKPNYSHKYIQNANIRVHKPDIHTSRKIFSCFKHYQFIQQAQ